MTYPFRRLWWCLYRVHITNVGFMYKYLFCVIIGFCYGTSKVLSTFLFALLWTSGVIASVFRCMVLSQC